MLHSSMMLRRDALVATGGYSLSYTTAIDLDLWWRMCYEGRLANHGEVLVKYRWHGANSSVLHRNLQWNEAREISTKHLVAYGIARSPSEAAAYITFFSSGADQPPQGNECEITTFAMFTDRLLAFVASLPHCDGEDIREVRRHLRWALIARALRCSRLSLNRYRFLFLSSRLFPEEGGFRSVLSRRLRNFFCGASWAIGSRHVR